MALFSLLCLALFFFLPAGLAQSHFVRVYYFCVVRWSWWDYSTDNVAFNVTDPFLAGKILILQDFASNNVELVALNEVD